MKFYAFARAVLRGLFSVMYRIKVVDAENEPKDAPFIVCANHISNTDVIVVGEALEHQLHYMAKQELFKVPVLRGLIRLVGAFPVKRGAADVGAIKTCLKHLEEGEVVAMFPQGKRCPSVDPRTTEPMPGVGMIAYRSKVPVLPVYVEVKNNKHRLFKRHTVRIGRLITQEEMGFQGGTKGEYERVAKLVFDRILEMSQEVRSETE